MKHVLILTDLYPPAWAPRMAALTQHLRQWGWSPIVFTEAVDTHQLFAGYQPPCPVHRVRLTPHNRVERAIMTGLELSLEYKERRFADAIRSYMKQAQIAPPDAILCSTYRKFPLGAARRLAQSWGIPWLADCRDIIEQYSPGDWLPKPLTVGGKRLGWLERALGWHFIRLRNSHLREATAITTVSRWHQSTLSSVSPAVHLVYNGYDPELFTPEYYPEGTFRIVYTGRLLSLEMRDPTIILRALDHPRLSELEIHLDLYTDSHSRSLLEERMSALGISHERIHWHAMVPHREIPSIIHRASVILLVGNEEGIDRPQGMVSTKLFEAIAVEKPVVLLPARHGEAAELLVGSGCGIATNDLEELVHYIYECWEQWRRDGFTSAKGVDRAFVRQFSRRRQAGQFAELLVQMTQIVDE